jgi:pimeloyl-ACP methyl ester carboxylesterase
MHIRLKGTAAPRRIGLAAVSIMLLAAFALPARAGATGQSGVTFLEHGICFARDKKVALSEGQPANQQVHTVYCQPYKWAHGSRQLDVLSSGSTYTSTYWMWPQQPKLYSYTEKTLKSGRAVMTYDRLGSGKSSRPVSTDVTIAADAHVLHQLIQWMSGYKFKKINSIGHSYGSGIALREATTYKDIDRLVLTGYMHVASNPAVSAGNYPANQDPAFAGQGLDNGYLTTRPGNPPARQTSFYSSSANPAVVAYDEAHKDLTSLTGLLGFLADRNVPATTNISQQIDVPVLAISGELDAIFCYNPAVFNCSDSSAMQAHEASYFTNAPSFTFKGVADTGHNLPLHPSANTSFNVINKWIKNQ